VGFVTLQAALAWAIALWLPELHDPYFGYKAARLQRRTRGRPVTVVMVGSSRTGYGLRASLLEDQLRADLGRPVVAFNFGIPAAGPVTQLLYVKRLLDRGVRPDLLLVEILPPLLDGQVAVPREASWLPPERLWLDEFALVQRFGFPVGKLRRTWWEGWPLPWFTHRFAILSRVAPRCLPFQLQQAWGRGADRSGWTPMVFPNDTPEKRRQGTERARAEYAAYLHNFCLGGPTCRAVRELLALCRARGVPTALVLMPEGVTFRSWYSPAAWGQVQAFLDEASRDFAAPVINAREWVAEEGFADSHHLLSAGAAAFTQRLGREALLPLLKRMKGNDKSK
jgi:hypothetical protein